MSFVDLLVSSVWFFTNMFIPSDVNEFPWALGNETSCSVQGFIVQFSISSVIYNAALSLYYVFIIKHKLRGPKLQRIEKWIHFVPIAFGLTTAISALKLDVYNFAVWDCWIAPAANGDGEKLARSLQWGFFFAPLWCAIIFATTNMILVFLQVRKEEEESTEWLRRREQRPTMANRRSTNTTALTSNLADSWIKQNRNSGYGGDSVGSDDVAGDNYNSPCSGNHGLQVDVETGPPTGAEAQLRLKADDDSDPDPASGLDTELTSNEEEHAPTRIQMKHTRAVAMQGMLYVGAFFITWLFPTISRIIQLCGGNIPPWLVVLSGTFIPSQGVFNALVYFRLRFINCEKAHPTKSKLWIIRLIISSTICHCMMNRTDRDTASHVCDLEPSCHNVSTGLRLRKKSSSSRNRRESSSFHSNLVVVAQSHSDPSYPSFPSEPSFEPSCNLSGLEYSSDAQSKSIEHVGSLEERLEWDAALEDLSEPGPPTGSQEQDPGDYYHLARDMVLSGEIKQPKPIFPRRYRDMLNDRKKDGDDSGNEREWLERGNRVLDPGKIISELSTIAEDADISDKF